MKISFHIHTIASKDSRIHPIRLMTKARKLGINTLFITDHETIKIAARMRKLAKENELHIIIGEEIRTEYGDIIGIFLFEEIKSNNFLEVANEIKKQDGLVVLPHPFRKGKLKLPLEFLKHIDLIETFNSRIEYAWNKNAQKLAKVLDKPSIIGSDAHFYSELNNVFMYSDAKSEADLKEAFLNNNIKFEIENRTSLNRLYFLFLSQIVQKGYLGTIKKIILKVFRWLF